MDVNELLLNMKPILKCAQKVLDENVLLVFKSFEIKISTTLATRTKHFTPLYAPMNLLSQFSQLSQMGLENLQKVILYNLQFNKVTREFGIDFEMIAEKLSQQESDRDELDRANSGDVGAGGQSKEDFSEIATSLLLNGCDYKIEIRMPRIEFHNPSKNQMLYLNLNPKEIDEYIENRFADWDQIALNTFRNH